MAKTSIISYSVAGLTAGFAVILIIIAVYSVPSIYDTGGFENTSFSEFDNLSVYADNVQNSSGDIYNVTTDKSLFDVLGGIVVDSLNAVRSVVGGVSFLKGSISQFMNGLGLPADVIFQVTKYIISVITIIIAGVFLFRVINKVEDER